MLQSQCISSGSSAGLQTALNSALTTIQDTNSYAVVEILYSSFATDYSALVIYEVPAT